MSDQALPLPTFVTKQYTGTEKQSAYQFEKDSAKMAAQGYRPLSQTWMPGQRGCGTFIGSLLIGSIFGLLLATVTVVLGIVIGLIITVGVFLGSKPSGVLMVNYELVESGK